MRILKLTLVAVLLLTGLASFAAYPDKPIKIIVAFPPGSSTDIVARTMSQPLSEALGQPVVIENRGGAGGNVGLEFAARTAPDGYTLLASSGSPVVVGPHLYKLSVDVARDLVPIVPLGRIMKIAARYRNRSEEAIQTIPPRGQSNAGLSI